jgi:hypothetical protein
MGSGDVAPPFLGLALDGGEWSSSCSCHFTPRETAPGTHCRGGWVGPTSGLDIMEKRNLQGIKPQLLSHPACSLVTMLTELSWLLLIDMYESKLKCLMMILFVKVLHIV